MSESSSEPIARALAAIEKLRGRVRELEGGGRPGVAVVGMGCRLPAGVGSVQEFWRLLESGQSGVRAADADRLSGQSRAGESLRHRWANGARAAWLTDAAVCGFDAEFFGISPVEASHMDPQQRIALEVTWDALRDAGIAPSGLRAKRVGVFVGVMNNDYARRIASPRELEAVDAWYAPGSMPSFIGGRIAFQLDVHGPCETTDTACSSSLVALHRAHGALRRRECDLAIVVGINLILAPEISAFLCSAGLMSESGECRSFAEGADGIVRGEGCGVVILQRSEDAAASGARLRALVLGSAVNHGGRSAGITAPSARAQELVMREALKDAQLPGAAVSFVEAHGTGTPLGDPIEAQALGAAYGPGRERPLLVASVKANFGHLEAAAGIIGFIKAVLSLQHRRVPAQPHAERPSQAIDWNRSKLELCARSTPLLPGTQPLRAAVSSFGLSGTNAHIVLEETPIGEIPQLAVGAMPEDLLLLPISATTAESVVRVINSWKTELVASPPPGFTRVAEACRAAALRCDHARPYRTMVHATSVTELCQALERRASETFTAGTTDAARVAFVYSGHVPLSGNSFRAWYDRCRVFREAFEDVRRRIEALGGPDVGVLREGTRAGATLRSTRFAQPAIFATQVALTQALRSWGVEVCAVLGHSVGEVAAFWSAQCLSIDDACELVLLRGRLMDAPEARGSMAVIELDATQVQERISVLGARVSVGAINDPTSCVISGSEAEVVDFCGRLEALGVGSRKLDGDYRFHCSELSSAAERLRQALCARSLRHSSERSARLYSTLTGDEYEPNNAVNGSDYWARQILAPVRFAAALDQAVSEGIDVIVELSVRSALRRHIQSVVEHRGSTARHVATCEERGGVARDPWMSIAELYELGVDLQWRTVVGESAAVSLPMYPWRHSYFRFESQRTSPVRASRQLRPAFDIDGCFYADLTIDVRREAWLLDHVVAGACVLPGLQIAELGGELAQQLLGGKAEWEWVEFRRPLELSDEAPSLLRATVTRYGDRAMNIELREHELAAGELLRDQPRAEPIATGRLRLSRDDVGTLDAPLAPPRRSVRAAGSLAQGRMSGEAFYRVLTEAELTYRDHFRTVQQVTFDDTAVEVELRCDSSTPTHDRTTVLDGALQASLVFIDDDDGTWLPARLEGLVWMGPPRPIAEATATVTLLDRGTDVLRVSVLLRDPESVALACVRSVELRRTARRRGVTRALAYGMQTCAVDGELAAAMSSNAAVRAETWLVVAAVATPDVELCAQSVAQAAQRAGSDCQRVALDGFADALRVTSSKPVKVIYLDCGELQHEAEREWQLTELEGPIDALMNVVRAVEVSERPAPVQLVVVNSKSADANSMRALQRSSSVGLLRVVGNECEQLSDVVYLLVDTASETFDAEAFGKCVATSGGRRELLLCGSELCERRLTTLEGLGAWGEPEQSAPGIPSGLTASRFALQAGEHASIDALTWRALADRPLGDHEVELEIVAAGLNFKDVLLASGILTDNLPGARPGQPRIGFECSGRVKRVGNGVGDLPIGSEVVALGHNLLGNVGYAHRALVQPKPAHLSFEQAAALPVAHLTAWYGLCRAGRARPAESVLIHSATGGLGLAALRLARCLGLRVVTSAGTAERREWLSRQAGVELVVDSRSAEFVDAIGAHTRGRGVDIVLNSRSGRLLQANLDALAVGGRLVEVGLRDYVEGKSLNLSAFQRNLTLQLVDLSRMMHDTPDELGEAFGELVRFVVEHGMVPDVHRVYEPADVTDALHMLSRGNEHRGKCIVTFDAVSPPSVAPQQLSDCAQGAWLITGGLGALGLTTAEQLIALGQTFVVLLGRHPPGLEAKERMRAMERRGAVIRTVVCDVANVSQLRSIIERFGSEWPKLVGVIHSAGAKRDGKLASQGIEHFRIALEAKALGAWNLHLLTRSQYLAHFVLFSSVSGWLGVRGQASYAAANTFLDELSCYRRRLGLASVSIAWGAWNNSGMAADEKVRDSLMRAGIRGMSVSVAKRAFTEVLKSREAQVAIVDVDARVWKERHGNRMSALLSKLGAVPTTSFLGDEKDFDEIPPEARAAALRAAVMATMTRIRGRAPTAGEQKRSFHDLGFDSLLLMEFRQAIQRRVGKRLPASALFNYPNIDALTAYLTSLWTKESSRAASTDGSQLFAALSSLTQLIALEPSVASCNDGSDME